MSVTNKFFQGIYTSTGAPLSIPLGFDPYEVTVTNNSSSANLITQSTVPLQAYWNIGMASNSARILSPSGTATAPDPQPILGTYVSTNGILVSSSSQISYGGTYTGTAFTSANPASITGITPASGSVALLAGQTGILWLSQATGASQWANAFYNFTATSATTVTLAGVNNTFVAGTTVRFTIVENVGLQMAQTSNVITAISSVSSTTTDITLSTNVSGAKAGNYIVPSIPEAYGDISQVLNPNNANPINNLGGYLITAVSGNVITILAATGGYSFSYPTDAVVQASLGKTYQKPVAIPSGVTASIYNQPEVWTGSSYITLGTSVVGLSGNSIFVTASTSVIS